MSKLSIEEREHVAKKSIDNMSESDIKLWKERLAREGYRTFDAYCPDCGLIREITLNQKVLKLIMEKHPLTGPKTIKSPQGSVICECGPCLKKRYPEDF